MDVGQSISFTSFDSNNYPTHNNLTFHQTQHPGSQYDLAKDSMIKNFPGKKVNLGQSLEVLVLLQTAQIERLTINLHQYRLKFKRIINNEKDYNSFKYQANELLQVKDELEFRNKKIHQFAENQKGELIDQIKYVQTLENKYRRALKLIQEAHLAKQQIQTLNIQQQEQIIQMERTFQAFKQRSIQEYQLLRDQLERNKNDELTIEINKFKSEKQRWGEIINREQTKYASQKQKYQMLLGQQRNQLMILSGQLQRWKKQIHEKNEYIQQITRKYKKNEEERENHFALLGTELQRLNNLLKDKASQVKQIENQFQEVSIRLNKKAQQSEWLKHEVQRHKNKNTLYEEELVKQNEEIGKLTTNISLLKNELHEMGLVIQQKDMELKLNEKKFAQQVEKYNQNIRKSENYFSQLVQQNKSTNNHLIQSLQKAKRQSISQKQSWNKRQKQWQSKIKQIESQKTQLNSNLLKQTSRLKDLQERHKLQTNKLVKDIEILRKKIEDSYIQKRHLEQTYRKQQKEFMQNYTRSHQQKWEELNQRYISANQQIKSLFQNKQILQKTLYSLRNSLQQSQIQKEQLRKCRTFQSMINEIQNLCQSTHQKDSQIFSLKNEIINLQEQIKKIKPQLQLLRQATIKLINLNNSNESNRRQDNYLLIEQIRKLFIQHSSPTEQIKENTHRIAYNYNKHKQFMEQTQNHLIKSKELQISDLKDKLSYNERENHSNNQLKDIINKIIVITKENSELKVVNSKKIVENQLLAKQVEELKNIINRNNQHIQVNIKEKDQMCKRLMIQLQESNSLLLQQKQNQMKLQSTLIILEDEKDKEGREVAIKENIIKELKNSIKTKDHQVQQLSFELQEVKRNIQRLKQQKRQFVERFQNLQTIIKQKDTHIKQLKDRYIQLQLNSKERQSYYEEQAKQLSNKLRQTYSQFTMQISKLKDQNNILISENSDLKQQMIRTGSTILNISQQNQQLRDYQIKYNSQIAQSANFQQQLSKLYQSLQQKQMIKYQYQNIKMQYDHLKRQSELNKKVSFNYSEKIQILQKEIKKMEGIIQNFQVKNSQLESHHYQQNLTIEKNKISQQKILVLNQEIDRLQRQRMNLIEELNICRLQISQESTLERQIKEYHILLVLLFAEIQSLRQSINKKQHQIDQFRRQSLK